MFQKKKKIKNTLSYDKRQKQPAIHISICTGEQVAGFKDLTTGKFEDIMLIRSEKDLEEFRRLYGISESEITREW